MRPQIPILILALFVILLVAHPGRGAPGDPLFVGEKGERNLDNTPLWSANQYDLCDGVPCPGSSGSPVTEPQASVPMPDIKVIHPYYIILPTRPVYSGPCPIGDADLGAPELKDPGYTSGALCRGACGEDCPDNTCQKYYNDLSPLTGFRSKDGTIVTIQPTSKIIQFRTGICVYPNTVRCKTSQGCRDHDACFDWCAGSGETAVTGPCHMKCTWACMCEYGTSNCVLWSGKLGDWISQSLQAFSERLYPPMYDPQELYFSDPPEFYENPVTPTPTVTSDSHWFECLSAQRFCGSHYEGAAVDKCLKEEYSTIPGHCE